MTTIQPIMDSDRAEIVAIIHQRAKQITETTMLTYAEAREYIIQADGNEELLRIAVESQISPATLKDLATRADAIPVDALTTKALLLALRALIATPPRYR